MRTGTEKGVTFAKCKANSRCVSYDRDVGNKRSENRSVEFDHTTGDVDRLDDWHGSCLNDCSVRTTTKAKGYKGSSCFQRNCPRKRSCQTQSCSCRCCCMWSYARRLYKSTHHVRSRTSSAVAAKVVRCTGTGIRSATTAAPVLLDFAVCVAAIEVVVVAVVTLFTDLANAVATSRRS